MPKDNVDKLIEKISNNTIDRAHFDTMSLSENQIVNLSNALKNNDTLIYLNLFDCQLNDEDLKTLKEGILNNTKLETLIIENHVDNPDYQDIMAQLEKNKEKCQATKRR